MLTGIVLALGWLPRSLVQPILDFNVSLTTAFIPLFIWRIGHRLLRRKSLEDIVQAQQHPIYVGLFHGFLYLLTLAVLCTGVLMMSHDIHIFGLISLPYLIEDPAQQALFFKAHKYTSSVLGLTVIVHVVAVVKHSLTGRSVLHKMC